MGCSGEWTRRFSIDIAGEGAAGGFAETVELIQEYERNGLELVAIPEAYSFDAVSQLGYIAAKTEKIENPRGWW